MIPRPLRPLYARVEGLLHEIAKFGLIGAIAFAVTALLSNGFRFGLHLGPLTSFGLATIITAVASYFANRHWTFRDKENAGVGRELPMFLLLSVIGIVISEAPVGVSEYLLHQHSALAYNISSTVIGTILGTVWRFCSFKRWIFVDAAPAARDEESAREALV